MKKKLTNIIHSPKMRYVGLCLGLCLLLSCVWFASCGDKESPTPPQTTETPTSPATEAPTSPAVTADPNDALRTHYESLIKELKSELLKEREDRYISDYEYQKRLEALEQALSAYEKATDKEDKPTVAPAETETETIPEETKPPVPTAPFEYRLEHNEVIITAYKGSAVTVMVPAEIAGHPVTAIDDHAFQNTGVVSVVLPATIKTIGWFAFYGCFGLEIVSIPTSVTDINYAAFDGCPNLTLLCPANSYAASYAVSFGIKHEYI